MSGRPPILFTASFGAGLATGLLHFVAPLGAAALLGALAWACRRRPLTALCLGAAGMGAVHAEVAHRREGSGCAARLPAAEVRLEVELEEPADPAGGLVGVRPWRAGCTGSVRARWPRGAAHPAGSIVAVAGRWIPRPAWSGRPAGTLVISAVRSPPAPRAATSLSARLRNGVARASRELFGARAPLVDALVVGRRADMDPDLKDAFAQSGLVHLLSISGFHVGLLAGWVVLLARALRARRERALIAAALLATLYVAFLGWPAPATRAAALATAAALCRARQRYVQADPLLVATCLGVMLVDPWAVLDLGGWLSAAALWGATACTRWSDRAIGTHAGWRCLASSVGATFATAPLTALALGTVALVGIVLNFAAIPLAAVAVPGVAASLLLWPVSRPLADALAGGAGLLLHLLELLARVGARVPGGHMVAEPGPAIAIPWALALGALLWGMHGRTTRLVALERWGWAVVAGLWLPLVLALRPAHPDGRLALHFLDVGQGDGAVIRTPGGRFVVVDAGPRTDRTDAGRRVVAPFLARQHAGRLAALIVSHAHADHVGGATSVLDRFPATVVLEPGAVFHDAGYARFLSQVAATGVPWRPGRPGDSFTLDGVRFTLLHPDTGWAGWGEDLNEDSLVLSVEYGSFRALFTGDIGLPAERHLAGRVGAVSVLKVGHHGSRTSTGDHWLAELKPRVAVLSVGANTYGHPAPATLARLARGGVALRRTDRDGTISVFTDGATMNVESRGQRAAFNLEGGR